MIPGCGTRVVNGYGAISGRALVNAASKRALAHVRRPDEHHLAGPLPRHMMAQSAFLRPRLAPLQFLAELAHLLLEIRLELLRPLVLGQQAEQLAKRLQPSLRSRRLAILLLDLEILWG